MPEETRSPLPASVKALAFDVFGTVVDWRGSVAREAEAIFAERGIAIDGDDFARRWRARYQPAMERVRAGGRDFVRLAVLHRENLDDLLRELRLDALDEEARVRLNGAWSRLDAWPDAPAGLARLKTRFVVATLSNGDIATMVGVARHGLARGRGLPWDAILGAEVARAYKPQPEAYVRSCEALGLRTDEVALVAAHNDDLIAAAATGMRTIFVPRPDEYGPDDPRDKRPERDYDLVAADFVDLADRLGVPA